MRKPSTSTSVSVRTLEIGCGYTTSDKAVKVEFTTHAHLDPDNLWDSSGIVSSSDAFLTLREATELVELLTTALAEAQKIAVEKTMAQL